MDQILETHPSNLSWEDPDWERGYRARELTAEEWNEQHDTFVRLYLDEDLSLTQVREIMAKEHNFYANEAQFKKRIRKWKISKNLKKETVSAMLQIENKRALEGKPTNFRYNGKPVEGRLERWRGKLELMYALDEGPSFLAATPPDVDYYTPGPETSEPGATCANVYNSGDYADAVPTEVALVDAMSVSSDLEGISSDRSPSGLSLDFMPAAHAQRPQGLNTANLPYEGTMDDSLILGGEGRDFLCDNYRGFRDIYHGNEFVGGPIVGVSQRSTSDKPQSGETISDRGEIERNSSDILWKSPGRGAASTIGSWIQNDVVMAGGSTFSFRTSSSHPKHKFELSSCCGISLLSMDELFHHYEEYHVRQKGSLSCDVDVLINGELYTETQPVKPILGMKTWSEEGLRQRRAMLIGRELFEQAQLLEKALHEGARILEVARPLDEASLKEVALEESWLKESWLKESWLLKEESELLAKEILEKVRLSLGELVEEGEGGKGGRGEEEEVSEQAWSWEEILLESTTIEGAGCKEDTPTKRGNIGDDNDAEEKTVGGCKIGSRIRGGIGGGAVGRGIFGGSTGPGG